jgi:CheY-like chemotaxis protein
MMDERKYKLLVIDDDTFILNMYVSKFLKAGHTVEIAKSAGEALTKIKEGYPAEIVLIDIVLPDMNGLDFLNTLRTEKLIPDAACIMFTNQNSPAETERAAELGVAGYIVKANLIPSEVVEKVLTVVREYKKV